MCLSTVYKNEKTPENEGLKNVMRIESEGGVVTLVDIMGREAGVPTPYNEVIVGLVEAKQHGYLKK